MFPRTYLLVHHLSMTRQDKKTLFPALFMGLAFLGELVSDCQLNGDSTGKILLAIDEGKAIKDLVRRFVKRFQKPS